MTDTLPHLRPLTAHEELYWQLNYNMPIHPVLAAQIAGSTTAERFRLALDAIQRRHPLLSVSIEEPRDARKFFRHDVSQRISLRVVTADTDTRWEEEVARELVNPFIAGHAPLLRAVLLQQAEQFVVIFAGSHSIVDGMSLSFLVRDFLCALAGEPLRTLPLAASEEELLKLAPVPFRAVAEEPEGVTSQYAGRLPRVLSLQCDPQLTAAIQAAARHHNATVHGALAAAFTISLRQLVPHFSSAPVRFISPVNIRPLLAVGEDLGMYFTSPQDALELGSDQDFWKFARSVRQTIVDGSTREAVQASTEAMRTMVANGLTRRAAADTLHGVFAEDMLLTNLGVTPYDSDIGPFRLLSLSPAVLAGLPAMQTVATTSTNGLMNLVQTSFEPVDGLLSAAAERLAVECT